MKKFAFVRNMVLNFCILILKTNYLRGINSKNHTASTYVIEIVQTLKNIITDWRDNQTIFFKMSWKYVLVVI